MFPRLDTRRLQLQSLTERHHNLDVSVIAPLEHPGFDPPDQLVKVARRIVRARNRTASVVLMMGAHVIRSGVQRYLIDLMERGFITCIAVNGACMVHDYEFALIGATTESVSRYIKDGRFGFWKETSNINGIVQSAADRGMGLGEALGEAIETGNYPHKDISLFAAGYRCHVPITVHVSIGQDIVHQHPNCEGATWGACTYQDFLIFAKVLESLEQGVLMNFGSAVMGPEVYLKALSMVRNLARQSGTTISDFTTLVSDIYPLPETYRTEADQSDPAYFFRPWKTILVRTVQDGGQGLYLNLEHRLSVPALWQAINREDESHHG